MEANIDELSIIKPAEFSQALSQTFKHHQEACSKTSHSVFSVKNATQPVSSTVSTALPECYCHSTGEKTKAKGCIRKHTNYEKYENLLVGNPIPYHLRLHCFRGGDNSEMCEMLF